MTHRSSPPRSSRQHGYQKPRTRDRLEIWREQAQELGVDVEHFIERARTGPTLSDNDREALLAQRLAELPSHLTEQESVFERRHVMAAVASSLVGTGASSERVDAEMERLTRTRRIVQLGQDIHGHGLYRVPTSGTFRQVWEEMQEEA